MNASKSRVNASSPPPINWATRPKPSSENSATHPLTSTAYQLVPVLVHADRLGDVQESVLQQPKCDLQDYVIINVRHFEEVLRRLSQLESSVRQFQREEGCFDEGDPSSELQMEDLMSTLSSLSVSTSSVSSQPLATRAAPVTPSSIDPVLSCSLAARPAPVSTPGISSQVSPRKKKYYVILVGKCAGIYYDDW
jgi:hypothetical protein